MSSEDNEKSKNPELDQWFSAKRSKRDQLEIDLELAREGTLKTKLCKYYAHDLECHLM